jgi:hypothetical protein
MYTYFTSTYRICFEIHTSNILLVLPTVRQKSLIKTFRKNRFVYTIGIIMVSHVIKAYISAGNDCFLVLACWCCQVKKM